MVELAQIVFVTLALAVVSASVYLVIKRFK